ncbi:hypothetical protein CEXT_45751 [Caerostris extrusa]|uniref:Uncharacterized protein n=1 Tax=Caerostris extrusa TaxID=172846 RepID=A0AAV4XNL0_CAEEX|nr:hypothetical protein CEXT_45751 [Caerostris extrusa]
MSSDKYQITLLCGEALFSRKGSPVGFENTSNCGGNSPLSVARDDEIIAILCLVSSIQLRNSCRPISPNLLK